MGIDNLLPFLREICPNACRKRPVSDFRGRRIAIDANNWMFANMIIAHRKVVDITDVAAADPDRVKIVQQWLSDLLEYVCKWLTYGVTPIFVFDGTHPEEKARTKQKRWEEREKHFQLVKRLREELDQIDLLLRSGQIVTDYKKALYKCSMIKSEDTELLKTVLQGIGIPMMQAKGDGEKLCSMLCREGIVAGVFSADSDNIVYGCPILITGFDGFTYDTMTGNKVHQVMTYESQGILNALGMSSESFIDFCIMLGCDYNDHCNIPGIGIKKAFELIKKFGTIDNIPRLKDRSDFIDPVIAGCKLYKTKEYDTRILNHEACRRLFSPTLSQDEILSNEVSEPLSDKVNAMISTKKDPEQDKSDILTALDAISQNYTSKIADEPSHFNNNVNDNINDNVNVRDTLAETGRDVLNQIDLTGYIRRIAPLYRQLPSPINGNLPPTLPKEEVIRLKSKTSGKTIKLLIVTEENHDIKPTTPKTIEKGPGQLSGPQQFIPQSLMKKVSPGVNTPVVITPSVNTQTSTGDILQNNTVHGNIYTITTPSQTSQVNDPGTIPKISIVLK